MSEQKICEALDAWLAAHKGGSPTDSTVFWVHYRPREIALLFKEASGYAVSHGLIKRRLLFLNFKFIKI